MSNHRLLRGLILRTVQVGDWNLYVHVLNADEGLVSCFVKGGKRQRSELFGLSRLYSLVELEVFQGRTTLSVDGGEIIYAFPSLQKDPLKLTAAGHAADLAIEILRDASHSHWLYPLLIHYFHAVDEGKASLEQLMASFAYRLLCEAGFTPLLNQDLRTGEQITAEQISSGRYAYHRQKGSLIVAGEYDRYMLKMTRSLWTALEYLRAAPIEQMFRAEMNQALVRQLDFFVTPVLEDQMEQAMTRLMLFRDLKELEAEAAMLQPRQQESSEALEDITKVEDAPMVEDHGRSED